MGQPHNVLRVHCNVSSEDFLEVGRFDPAGEAEDPSQEVYVEIQVAETEEYCGSVASITLTRREACELAHRILREFQEVPSTPYRD